MAIQHQQLEAAIRSLGDQLVAVLRSVRNPEAIAIGEWTVGDVAAHLSHAFEVETRIVRGEASTVERLDQVDDFNAQYLRADPERDPRTLADRIEAKVAEFLEAVATADLDQVVSWHGGLKLPLGVLPAVMVNELLLHGYDIAHAAGAPWRMERAHAALGIQGVSPLLPHYLDESRARGVRASYEIRLRGNGRSSLFLTLDDGRLTLGAPADGKVDCHISADPVAFLLVGYGRISQLGPILRGQMLAWGRKPWLAPKLATMLRSP